MKNHYNFFSLVLLCLGVFFLTQPLTPETEENRFSSPFFWPTIPSSIQLSSTFGESRTKRFHLGVDIAGYKEKVYPMQNKGRIIYYRLATDNPFLPLTGGGNTLFLEYENNIMSGYFHLNANSFYAKSLENQLLTQNTVVAISGNSGRSYGAHLHFFLYDRIKKKQINPQKKLEKLTDNHPPRILQLVLLKEKKDTSQNKNPSLIFFGGSTDEIRESTLEISQNYPIYAYIVDRGEKKDSRLGIYKIRWALNGSEFSEIKFDECRVQENQWLCDGKSFTKVYFKNFYLLDGVEFIQGTNSLEIEVEDFSGNQNKATFVVNVNLIHSFSL